jgi:hypothetical protein
MFEKNAERLPSEAKEAAEKRRLTGEKNVPQRQKPAMILQHYGTTEVVPLQSNKFSKG